MNQYNNSVKICTSSSKGEYTLSISNTKQAIALTNNRAQYYAQQAEKYKEEAKEYRDNAKYYAEQNSDVTYEYINTIKSELIAKIDIKQNVGDYALRAELPTKTSELLNDSNFANANDVVNRDLEIVEQLNLGIEQINEELSTKVDKESMVEVTCIVETYINGTSWYRVWSDGYCMQGGKTSGENRGYLVTLLKPYKDTNYTVVASGHHSDNTDKGWNYTHTLTATSFKMVQVAGGNDWIACGYIA